MRTIFALLLMGVTLLASAQKKASYTLRIQCSEPTNDFVDSISTEKYGMFIVFHNANNYAVYSPRMKYKNCVNMPDTVSNIKEGILKRLTKKDIGIIGYWDCQQKDWNYYADKVATITKGLEFVSEYTQGYYTIRTYRNSTTYYTFDGDWNLISTYKVSQ